MDALIENITAIDWDILRFIHGAFSCGSMDNAMSFLTYFLGYIIWVVFAVFLIIKKSTRFDGIFLGATMIISVLIVQFLLKPLILRDRPYTYLDPEIFFYVEDVGNSFPSSHTSLVCAASAYCCKISRRLIAPAYLIAATVAFSRLYLFAHFPSDVLAGAAIGTALGVVMARISKTVRKRLDRAEP